MKDEDRQIIWLDYFESSLPRRGRRRVPQSMALRGFELDSLKRAAEVLGLEPTVQEARHPARPNVISGYISIRKTKSKSQILRDIAREAQKVKAQARNAEKSSGK